MATELPVGASDERSTVAPPVLGPLGTPLTLQMLPPPDTRRWVVRRKAEVLAAIRGGLLSRAEACTRYRISDEELRESRVLIAGGPRHNTPYQQYLHHFEVRAREYERSDGTMGASYTTLVRPSGLDFIARRTGRIPRIEP